MKLAKIKVAILGSGNIGADLCERLLTDNEFEVVALVGRREKSPGLQRFAEKVKYIYPKGIDAFLEIVDEVEGVFDATSAFSHKEHWNALRSRKKWMIDLTPSKIGTPIVPELLGRVANMQMSEDLVANYSMVTCGGQSSAPLLHAISTHSTGVTEVEVSSSIASLSAGPATRKNIDQYIQSTENLVTLITGCSAVKSILVLNPADPPVMMRTTVQMRVKSCDIEATRAEARTTVARIQRYVPGYDIVVEPHLRDSDLVSATAKVTGAGYFLPPYAGNLDIINAAAVETARIHASNFQGGGKG